MDAFPDRDEADTPEAFVTLRLREGDGTNPPGVLEGVQRALAEAVAEAQAGVPEPPIDPADFQPAPRRDLRAIWSLARELIAPEAAQNPERVTARDERRQQPGGVSWLAARQSLAVDAVHDLGEKLDAIRLETIEVEIPEAVEAVRAS